MYIFVTRLIHAVDILVGHAAKFPVVSRDREYGSSNNPGQHIHDLLAKGECPTGF